MNEKNHTETVTIEEKNEKINETTLAELTKKTDFSFWNYQGIDFKIEENFEQKNNSSSYCEEDKHHNLLDEKYVHNLSSS